MILLFDNGGEKIAGTSSIGHSVGKFTVTKIWATYLTGMAGTRVDKYNTIDEALLDLAKKGDKYSPVLSDEGIEVAHTSPDDMNVIIVKKYRVKNGKVQEDDISSSMKLEDFILNWNKYANTGISTTPTDNWVDDTN